MGVHGLWELLAPVGHRVSNDHVRNKVVAVDISIWLTQFVKAMRDAEGAQVRNAHLLGVFRRCIKLLFLAVKPVLVFDGATPAIKRRTLNSRRMQREKHAAKLRRLAEKLLVNQLKASALKHVVNIKKKSRGKSATNKKLLPNNEAVAKSSTESTPEKGNTSNNIDKEIDTNSKEKSKEKEDSLKISGSRSEEVDDVEEIDFTVDADEEIDLVHENSLELPTNIDNLDEDTLVELPANMQSNLFKQIKEEHRARHRESMMQKRHDPTEFSKSQIEGFLRHTQLNRKISRVRKEINFKSGANRRIASDSNRQYLLEERDLSKPENDDFDDNDSDYGSDDSELTPSVTKSKAGNVVTSTDLLAQIRSSKQGVSRQFLNRTTASKMPKPVDKISSGVGWASKVLSGQGGLALNSNFNKGADYVDSIEASKDTGKNFEVDSDGELVEITQKEQKSNSSPHDDTHENDSSSDSDEWEDGDDRNQELPSFKMDIEEPIEKNVAVSAAVSEQKKNESPTSGKVIDVVLGKSPAVQAEEKSDSESSEGEFIDLEDDDYAQGSPVPQLERQAEISSERREIILDEQNANMTSDIGDELQASEKPQQVDETIVEINGSHQQPSVKVVPKEQENSLRILASNTQTKELKSNRKQPSSEQKERPPASPEKGDELEITPVVESNDVSAPHVTQKLSEYEADLQIAISNSLEETQFEKNLSKANKPYPNVANKEQGDATVQLEISSNILSNDGNTQTEEVERNSKVPAEKSISNLEKTTEATQDTSRGKNQDSRGEIQANIEESQENLASKEIKSANEAEDSLLRDPNSLSVEQMQNLQRELDIEANDIRKQQASNRGAAESVSDEMYSETRDLLKLLGIPYLEAPEEAEAQCAFLNKEHVVDAVITEDSDAFLFGATTVYRQLFSEGRFAEAYEISDVEKSLGLTRNQLIRLAYLLGSDYTIGVRGVGVVNSMEILEAFPGPNGLNEFHEWTKSVTILDEEPDESVMKSLSEEAVRRRFCWKHRNMKRNWEIREGFANPAVFEAYLKPAVNTSTEKFSWKKINFEGLAKFCWEKFGWDKEKFDRAVGPLRKELAERAASSSQRRIDEYFKPHRFAKIRSVRLQTAVKGMAGEEAQEIMSTYNPQKRKRRRAVSQGAHDLSPEEEEQMLDALEKAESEMAATKNTEVQNPVRKRKKRKPKN